MKENNLEIKLKTGEIIKCDSWGEYCTRDILYSMLVPCPLLKEEKQQREYPKVPIKDWNKRVLVDISAGIKHYSPGNG